MVLIPPIWTRFSSLAATAVTSYSSTKPRRTPARTTSEPRASVPIPGRPWGFGDVFAAEAAGDLEDLEARGRRVARVHLAADVDAGLAALETAIGREAVA